jgi:septal ring factor EnvC (AmiA/AmiB activator)
MSLKTIDNEKKSAWIPWVLLIALLISLFFNYQQCRSVGTVKDELLILEAKNNALDMQSEASKQKQDQLDEQINTKKDEIAAFENSLQEKINEIAALNGELKRLKKKPEFKELKECQTEYDRLFKDYKLCLNLNDKHEATLHLCIEENLKKDDLISLQEEKFNECQIQNDIYVKKIGNYETALKNINKKFKKKTFKSLLTGAVVTWGVMTVIKLISK